MTERVIIFDTTLRDGEQSPGATMFAKEKITLAQMLDDMGVDVIEAGFAAASPGDLACIQEVSRHVTNATICSLSRGIISDIRASAKALEFAHKPRIHTFISTSDVHIQHQFRMSHEQVLETIDNTVRYACSVCDDVEWSAMDATRSDMGFLMKAVGTAIQAGARTINIPDTVGYTMPHEYQTMMSQLVQAFPQTIFSVHCHNDLGMATANSIAGVMGGARQVECTINGIGERAGNAALEEVVMALKTRAPVFGCDTGIDTRQIYHLSQAVSGMTGFPVQKNKAIVGRNAFAHESGIHQDGMLKNRDTYEIMSPASVGVTQSQIIMGKHSGRAALDNWAKERGIILTKDELNEAFIAFKAVADSQKHIAEADIFTAIQPSSQTGPYMTLVSVQTTQDAYGQNSADVSVAIAGKQMTLSAPGDGPVDAVFHAIGGIVPSPAPHVQEHDVHGVSYDGHTQSESYVTLTYQDKSYTGHAHATDTLMASAFAYVSAMNKILAQPDDHAKMHALTPTPLITG